MLSVKDVLPVQLIKLMDLKLSIVLIEIEVGFLGSILNLVKSLEKRGQSNADCQSNVS